MDKYFTEKAPKWVQETNKKYDLVLGDDIDSLASCCLLKEITGNDWEINHFYDFKSFYTAADKISRQMIGVDMSFVKDGIRCFDNHVNRIVSGVPFSNSAMFNVNLMYEKDSYFIARDNYKRKYSLSTLLEIWSYYDFPLPKTTLGKEVLLAIDTSFKGHYVDYFHDIHTMWLGEALQFPELIDILKQHDKEYFYGLIKQFGLNEKIAITDDGTLKTNIDLDNVSKLLGIDISLPIQKFKLIKQFERCGHKIGEKRLPDRKDIVSLAYTSSNYVSYTKIKGSESQWEKVQKLIFSKH